MITQILMHPQSRMIDNELDYLQMAYFKTTIGVRNSFQVKRLCYFKVLVDNISLTLPYYQYPLNRM